MTYSAHINLLPVVLVLAGVYVLLWLIDHFLFAPAIDRILIATNSSEWQLMATAKLTRKQRQWVNTRFTLLFFKYSALGLAVFVFAFYLLEWFLKGPQ